ncbi:MAG TPA: TIGR03435 family protein [Bryobacteraceae bacterium]|jgi:uncharacterized protein (TIGR03435 family)|nr:TIGR03435 family protein [Bryobacteraceae bacterium]
MRIVSIAAAVFTVALANAPAQSPATPAFDVASVKALPPAARGGGFQVTPDGVFFHGYPLGFIIRWAYGLHAYQAFETVGPDWLEPGLGCVRFDVAGKVDHPVPVEQLRLMLRSLLAERLRLSLHRGTKEMTVAAIAAGKGGPKLHESAEIDMTVTQEGEDFRFKGASLSRLDEWLYQVIPYLIVDDTGLQGRYDFDLDVARYRDLANPPAPGNRLDLSPAVNKALQPLGLELELKRRPVQVLIIDRAEKVPTEN